MKEFTGKVAVADLIRTGMENILDEHNPNPPDLQSLLARLRGDS
jgi:hypothetical protein